MSSTLPVAQILCRSSLTDNTYLLLPNHLACTHAHALHDWPPLATNQPWHNRERDPLNISIPADTPHRHPSLLHPRATGESLVDAREEQGKAKQPKQHLWWVSHHTQHTPTKHVKHTWPPAHYHEDSLLEQQHKQPLLAFTTPPSITMTQPNTTTYQINNTNIVQPESQKPLPKVSTSPASQLISSSLPASTPSSPAAAAAPGVQQSPPASQQPHKSAAQPGPPPLLWYAAP